jgi:hypothetical protein
MDSFISLFDPGCSDETPSSSSSSSSSICKIGNRQKGFVLQNQNGIVDNNNYPGVMERRGNKEGDDNNIIHDLPPEPQLGNIEYKLKLVNPSRHRFEHLVTQVSVINVYYCGLVCKHVVSIIDELEVTRRSR